jgi:hypothetical protein
MSQSELGVKLEKPMTPEEQKRETWRRLQIAYRNYTNRHEIAAKRTQPIDPDAK